MRGCGLVATALVVGTLGCKGDPSPPRGSPPPPVRDAAVDAVALSPPPPLTLTTPAPRAHLRLRVSITRWSTTVWEPVAALERLFADAGVGVTPADAATAALLADAGLGVTPPDALATIAGTLDVTYRETRGATYRAVDTGEQVASTRLALTVTMTSADGSRRATVTMTGAPADRTGYLEHGAVAALRGHLLYGHLGTIAAHVAGVAGPHDLLAIVADESVHPADRDTARLFAQLGLRPAGDDQAFALARTRKWPACRALGAACAEAAAAVVRYNGSRWYGSGQRAQLAEALGVLAETPAPTAIDGLVALADALRDPDGHDETQAQLDAALVPALVATGSAAAWRPLAERAPTMPAAAAGLATLRARLADRPRAAGAVVVDAVVRADPGGFAFAPTPDLAAWLDASVRRAGLTPVAAGAAADGYAFAELRLTDTMPTPEHTLELRVLDLRRGVAGEPTVATALGDPLDPDALVDDRVGERALAALAALRP